MLIRNKITRHTKKQIQRSLELVYYAEAADSHVATFGERLVFSGTDIVQEDPGFEENTDVSVGNHLFVR